jgi:hypothetical protein
MMIKTVKFATVLITLALVAGACSGGGKGSESNKDRSRDRSRDESSFVEETKPKKREIEKSERVVSQTISDPDLGYSITVNKITRGDSFAEDTNDYLEDDSVPVMVEITGANNSSYYSSLTPRDFRIILSNGESLKEQSYNLKKTAAKNGRDLLPSLGISRGDTVTGWITFQVPSDEIEKLKFAYVREVTRLADGGSLPELKVEVPLP